MKALQIIAAQVIAGTTYSAALLRVNLKAFRDEQAKKAAEVKEERYQQITIRASGKCHPALFDTVTKTIAVVCNCPNSQNGQLAARGTKVGEGYKLVNCRK